MGLFQKAQEMALAMKVNRDVELQTKAETHAASKAQLEMFDFLDAAINRIQSQEISAIQHEAALARIEVIKQRRAFYAANPSVVEKTIETAKATADTVTETVADVRKRVLRVVGRAVKVGKNISETIVADVRAGIEA